MIRRERVDVDRRAHPPDLRRRIAQLAERFPEIDLIVGGHEHFPITATVEPHAHQQGRLGREVRRADRPARSGPDAPVERFYELIPITSALPDEPTDGGGRQRVGGEARRRAWTSRSARHASPLDGTSPRLRASETNLGNLVADAVRADARSRHRARQRRRHPRRPRPSRRARSRAARSSRSIRSATSSASSRVPGRVIVARARTRRVAAAGAAGQFPAGVGADVPRRTRTRRPASRVSDVRVTARRSIRTDLHAGDSRLPPAGGDGYTMFEGQQDPGRSRGRPTHGGRRSRATSPSGARSRRRSRGGSSSDSWPHRVLGHVRDGRDKVRSAVASHRVQLCIDARRCSRHARPVQAAAAARRATSRRGPEQHADDDRVAQRRADVGLHQPPVVHDGGDRRRRRPAGAAPASACRPAAGSCPRSTSAPAAAISTAS